MRPVLRSLSVPCLSAQNVCSDPCQPQEPGASVFPFKIFFSCSAFPASDHRQVHEQHSENKPEIKSQTAMYDTNQTSDKGSTNLRTYTELTSTNT